ncbi:co-chaperone GroES [soil metagenome]
MPPKTMNAPSNSNSSASGFGKSETSGFRPLHDKILIKRDKAADRTTSGLYLPENAKDTPKTGIIHAVGTGTLNTETGHLTPLTVKKGDRVLFSSYAGTEIKLGSEEFLVMTQEEVMAVIED